jgi:hypothetical protein
MTMPATSVDASEHPDGISSPFKAGLSNSKRICSRPNATEVNIDSQTSNVIMQDRDPRSAQELIARVSEDYDIVGPFLASDRKIKQQVPSGSGNFQRRLASASWALPASHRSFTKIQGDRVSRFYRVSRSHPQPSAHREEQNSSSGNPNQHTCALHRRLPTKLLELLETRTA